ncbi:MAG: LysR family transcriptional regulator [Kofleriaceae bacterium]
MLVASADEGSLSAAARKLRIPVATLTRNVNDLEALVGAKLLVRTTRKLVLTDAGTDYIVAARRILDDVDEQERRAIGEFTNPRGELVIATPVQVGRLRVLPVINQFLNQFPEIRIRVLQSDRNIDLIDAHADAAVRIGRLNDSSLVAVRLGALRTVTVASPALLKKHGTPRSPSELHDYPRVVFNSPFLSPWRFRDPEYTISDTPRLLVSSPDAAADAAIDGVGATMLLEHDVADAVNAGKLRFVLQKFEVEPVPVHLVHASRDMPMKLRRFIDFAVPRLRTALSTFVKT